VPATYCVGATPEFACTLLLLFLLLLLLLFLLL